MYSKCQKCGRKLTDPDSIQRGYGPECWEEITGHYPSDQSKDRVSGDTDQIPGQMNVFDYPELLPNDI